MDKAPEVTALVQPNSADIGLKKTPKDRYIPQDMVMIRKETATTV